MEQSEKFSWVKGNDRFKIAFATLKNWRSEKPLWSWFFCLTKNYSEKQKSSYLHLTILGLNIGFVMASKKRRFKRVRDGIARKYNEAWVNL